MNKVKLMELNNELGLSGKGERKKETKVIPTYEWRSLIKDCFRKIKLEESTSRMIVKRPAMKTAK